jgi:hypothetical protein
MPRRESRCRSTVEFFLTYVEAAVLLDPGGTP